MSVHQPGVVPPAWAPGSDQRFPDGRAWRVEIPSVESPAALDAVIEESRARGVRIDRISQGSGIGLLLDAEIRHMVQACREDDIQLLLFIGPRGGFDIGAAVLASNGGALKGALRGARQLRQAIEEIERAAELGVDGVLVADIGLLSLLGEMRAGGELPSTFVLKVSVLAGPANPASSALMARLGADSLNLPADLSVAEMGEVRAATDVVIDLYIESPDDLGGFVRYGDIAELVRVAAPLYLKFGLRNAPQLYPAGGHLDGLVVAAARERVRRAEIGLEHLRRAGVGVRG